MTDNITTTEFERLRPSGEARNGRIVLPAAAALTAGALAIGFTQLLPRYIDADRQQTIGQQNNVGAYLLGNAKPGKGVLHIPDGLSLYATPARTGSADLGQVVAKTAVGELRNPVFFTYQYPKSASARPELPEVTWVAGLLNPAVPDEVAWLPLDRRLVAAQKGHPAVELLNLPVSGTLVAEGLLGERFTTEGLTALTEQGTLRLGTFTVGASFRL